MDISAYDFMKLVFIYGPPGAGKLTIARELSKLIRYPVFHNHIAIDAVRPLYGHGNKKSEEMIRAVNLAAIMLMSVKKENLIFTYARPNDRTFIRKVVEMVELHGGKVVFAELICSKNELHKRILLRDGSKYSKISDRKSLDAFEKSHGPFRKITLREGVTINTTKLDPKEAALVLARSAK
jgi:predicted kinase